MQQPTFVRSVVLLLQNGQENGYPIQGVKFLVMNSAFWRYENLCSSHGSASDYIRTDLILQFIDSLRTFCVPASDQEYLVQLVSYANQVGFSCRANIMLSRCQVRRAYGHGGQCRPANGKGRRRSRAHCRKPTNQNAGWDVTDRDLAVKIVAAGRS